MSDFESQITDQRCALGNRSKRGRRPTAVQWDRINGEPIVPKRGIISWLGFAIGRLLKWTMLLVLVPLVCYVAIGGLGAWFPVNSDFEPASNGVEIFIYSGNAHSELILPINATGKNWSDHFTVKPDRSASHIAIGWGDRRLYTRTRQWADLEIATAFSAMLLPTDAVLHVEYVSQPYNSARSMEMKISTEQYQQMCTFIENTFDGDQPLEGISFGDFDQFYPATGRYHLFNTCNNWVGEAMKAAGMKVGRYTPLPKTVFWHLNH